MKKNEVRLTQLASAAGCGAKIGPKVLAQVVGKLPKFTDPMLVLAPNNVASDFLDILMVSSGNVTPFLL